MHINNFSKISILALRISLGWLFFYAGITKVMDPEWTAAGYLKGAKTFSGLFQWFASSSNIGWVNFLNEWGLTLIGAALILGIFVRWASFAGIVLMVLYYLPILNFPNVGHGYIVDEHIIYIFVFLLLIATKAGQYIGIDGFISKIYK